MSIYLFNLTYSLKRIYLFSAENINKVKIFDISNTKSSYILGQAEYALKYYRALFYNFIRNLDHCKKNEEKNKKYEIF